ncbi:tyrosine-protein phosphatase [Streptomyces sp. NPDC006552]|uniref:tyrosine-protein phosphatase n=1 Tax=Streptomyces sp. NPDC006552 TaxID=3157179 RepID=UPI0033BCA100
MKHRSVFRRLPRWMAVIASAVCLTLLMCGSAAQAAGGVVVDGVLNFRDTGGHPAAPGGRTREDVLFRAGALDTATDAGVATLAALHVRTVVDLRSEGERAGRPDRLPAGAVEQAYPIVALDGLSSFAQLTAMTADEQEALLGAGRARRMMVDAARQFVTDPQKRAAFGAALRTVADSGDGAVVVHCSGGRDRTGWLVAVVQTLLGVDHDEVLADYLRSNTELAGWKAATLSRLAAAGMSDPHLVDPLLDVDGAYLRASFDQAEQSYGSFRAFVRDGLGVSGAELARLRTRLG